MKKYFILIICFFLIPVFTYALVKPSNLLYVTDEADIIRSTTEEYIVKYSDFLSKAKGIHYYVVTVHSLEDYEMDQYAEYVFQSFGVGEKGVLLFAAEEERMVQVIFGSKLMQVMEEEEISEYIDRYLLNYWKNGDLDKGIKNGYAAFYKQICNYYHINANNMELLDGNAFFIKYRTPIIMVSIVLGMFFSYTICQFFRKKYRHKRLHFFDYFSFISSIVGNVGLCIVCYSIELFMLIVLLGTEFFAATSVFGSSSMSIEEAFSKVKKEELKKKMHKKRKIIRKKRK